MRIAVGQISQETNTFNPLPTTRQNFEELGIYRGADVITAMAHTNEPGGFIQSLRRWPEKPDVIGLVRLMAWPSGCATAATHAWLLSEMLNALEMSLPYDGVLLSLHGAMVAEGAQDV